ncbi:MAG: nucleotidyltransferase family protein [Vicinamibacterales bacterium]
MKAFLLAGGRGERLRPLTLTVPKCLVPINGVPLLEIWLDRCRREGIGEVLLNVSHHAGRVREFLNRRAGPPRVELVVEAEPQGTAGTVAMNRRFVEGEESFWVIYADNLTDCSLAAMLDAHRRHDALLTMALFHAPEPTAAGIVDVQPDGRIVSFEEKPARPRSDLASAGIYLARSGLLGELPHAPGRVVDFGFDVLPRLVGRMYGHVIDGFIADIGSPAALARASAGWEAIGRADA